MIGPEEEVEADIKGVKRRRYARNLTRSIAELSEDVERLTNQLNTERFCYITAGICVADGIVFTYYNTVSAPICLTILEVSGLFVLARYLEIGEVTNLIVTYIKSKGKGEVDRPSTPEDKADSKTEPTPPPAASTPSTPVTPGGAAPPPS